MQSKTDIIDMLEEIAMLLQLKGENPFKVRAYSNATRTLNALDAEVITDHIEGGTLGSLKGIGKALVEKITTFATTGELAYLTDLRGEFPETLFALMDLPGLGPKKIKLYYDELGVDSIEKLEEACQDGRIAGLPKSGEKTAQNLLQAIERSRKHASLFHIEIVRDAAERMVATLQALPEVQRIEVCGSVRRFKEITKDADILASSNNPEPIMDAFVNYADVQEILVNGKTKSSVILNNGLQMDLRIVSDDIFPYTLHHFTGSKDHNVEIRSRAIKMGMKVSEWGLFDDASGDLIPCADEAELFEKLGLAYIQPELREAMGEIEAAEEGPIEGLVEVRDYKGVLHCHSHASDGKNSISELCEYAWSVGHNYLGITDHSKSSFQANGLSVERLLAQQEKICELRKSLPDGFRLFAGIECDIMGDGSLDYDDEVLAHLDYAVIAVHNALTKPRAEQTERILRAMAHPKAKILAHPTNRLLLKRDQSEMDIDAIIDAAIEHNVALEFNCQPSRLDLDWRLWKRAGEKGVLCSLNPDAHHTSHFDFIERGVQFCRKGWLKPEQIINCWPAEKLVEFFAN